MVLRLGRWRYCLRCDNKGFTVSRGERIPREELHPAQIAEAWVNGGWFYREVKTPCSCPAGVTYAEQNAASA